MTVADFPCISKSAEYCQQIIYSENLVFNEAGQIMLKVCQHSLHKKFNI